MTKYPNLNLGYGEYRKLTYDEKKSIQGYSSRRYKYVVTKPFTLVENDTRLTIPRGFLTDGSTGGPDWGCSWVYHDYLYCSHGYNSGERIDRRDADRLMSIILKTERRPIYRAVFRFLSKLNPFRLFSKAWINGGIQGPQYLKNY